LKTPIVQSIDNVGGFWKADIRDSKTKIYQTKRETRKQGTLCEKKELVEGGQKIRKTYKSRVWNYRERQTQR
jgi:hypothetical protein